MATSDSTHSLKEADRFFEQGNFLQAIKCYRQLEDRFSSTNELIAQRIQSCLKQLLRKYWRQEKADQMMEIMKELGVEQALALSHARLKGKAAIAEIMPKVDGIQAKLVQCCLQEDLKSALLSLRQLPELKTIAEGWLALLKGDLNRAFASFDEAERQVPLYAKIGKGVVYLSQGNLQQAVDYLSCLKPFASRHFPMLAKEIGWEGDTNQDIKRKMSFYIFSASLEELKHAESSLPSQQAEMKGWMWLRIGDYLVSKSIQDALHAWDKAKRLNPKLALDELKRRFLLAYHTDCSINPTDAFQAFYRKLVELTPQDAKEFIEYLIFDSYDSLGFLQVQHLKKGDDWIIDPPPIELRLLWLYVFYQDCIDPILQLLFFDPADKQEITLPWEEWRSIFQLLDGEYGRQEGYLRRKLGVARMYEQEDEIRSSIVQILHLNTMLKDELLPLYVQHTLSKLLDKSTKKEKKQEIGKEIESLRHFWSSDYDLIRLLILADVSDQSSLDLAASLGIHLSEPLRQVLQFQVAVDQGWGIARSRKLFPDQALYTRDREASWRLLMALFHPPLKFPKRELEQMLSLFARDSSSKHKLFSTIEQYGVVVPLSLLRNWQKEAGGWKPSYHLAIYYQFKKDFDEALTMLHRTYHQIPRDAKEAILIERTLKYYLEADPFEKFSPIEMWQFLEELFNE